MFLSNAVVQLANRQQRRRRKQRKRIWVGKVLKRQVAEPPILLDMNEPPNEQLEEEWQNQISERLSSLLQGLEEPTISKSDVCPFDALSEVPIDDQRF